MAARGKKKQAVDLEGEADPRAPLDWQRFLTSAQPVLKKLKADLAQRAAGSPSVAAALAARHASEQADRRTADNFIEWRARFVEQVAAAWVLSCVFARTLEDRGLLGQRRLGGPGAADSLKQFLELAPSLNERDYLLTIFRELTRSSATAPLFDARHNPVWLLAPSADGARALLQLFSQPHADLPAFRFGQRDTAFLGWIYQDLDEDVRARFALLQTPRFVESFILDRTLEPAIEKFGLDDTTIVDPTCGSGHFLLGAFDRLLDHRLRNEPGLSVGDAAKKALDAIHGADVNPYAVAIARFRLTLAFLDRAEIARLDQAPPLPLHVVVADSLLHNPHLPQMELGDRAPSSALWRGEELALEDEAEAKKVLHQQFAAVVGNPPYITVKDAALRERYRGLYPRSAAGKYSIAAPFTERFFHLARAGGRVGMITANSFMKREFGKKLIEQYLPSVNLDLVINTSGAYIPGHGTPTVLLFGSHEPARGGEVATVLASRGEPTTPEDAEQGLVWRSIADHWSEVGFENEYISVAKTAREMLAKHPWSLGGGGAAELKELLEERAEKTLGEIADSIGISSFTLEDEVFLRPASTWSRVGVPPERTRPMVIGEVIRDWSVAETLVAFWPYDENFAPVREEKCFRAMWPWRTTLSNNKLFAGKTKIEGGLRWYEFGRLTSDKLRTPLTITFAEVATHNHFVLDRGGKVFKQTAPIIKLPPTATEDDHLALLAYLNSSTACFWLKQVAMNKGGSGIGRGIQDEAWESRFQFDGTKLGAIALPGASKPSTTATRHMLQVIEALTAASAPAFVERALRSGSDPRPLDPALSLRRQDFDATLARAVSLQEEIDWLVYESFGLLTADDLGDLHRARSEALPAFPQHFDARGTGVSDAGLWPGHRAFEVVLARDAGARTQWFARNDYRLPVDLAGTYSPAYLRLIETRVRIIDRNPSIRLLEQPEHKRRWTVRDFDAELAEAMRSALDEAAERAVARAAHVSRRAEVLRDAPAAWDASSRELAGGIVASGGGLDPSLTQGLLDQSVPFLAALRFTADGLEKHAEWLTTWALQRREDAGETLAAPILVPPKYAQTDYRASTTWQLRGPLDVPKERFISYPGCESHQDGEPVYGWAGWDHEQRAKALATLYWNRKTEESWPAARLTPMLAGLLELLPWLAQWHAASSDEYAGDSPASYYAGFLDAECRAHGLTPDQLRAWRPAERSRAQRPAAAKPAPTGGETPEPPRKKRTNKDVPSVESP